MYPFCKVTLNLGQQHMPYNAKTLRQRQKDGELEVNLGYIARLCPKQQTKIITLHIINMYDYFYQLKCF